MTLFTRAFVHTLAKRSSSAYANFVALFSIFHIVPDFCNDVAWMELIFFAFLFSLMLRTLPRSSG